MISVIKNRTTCVLLILCWCIVSVSAQENKSDKKVKKPSLFNYLSQQDEGIMTFNVQTNINRLIRLKLKEEYQPAFFSFTDDSGVQFNFNARIRTRGNIRKEVCLNPPVKINMKGKELKANGFSGKYEVLKLVLQCSKGKGGVDLMERELLVYKLYELISPYAYKTLPVKLNMESDKGRKESFDAFLIEHEDDFEARLNGKVLVKGKIRPESLYKEEYLRMCFFQYMILNTDWSIWSKHNVEFIKCPDVPLIIPVPYDFDYAGFVGANYAQPHETIPIDHVTVPYFLGKDISEEEALETAAYFLSKKDELYSIVQSFEFQNERSKKVAIGYMDKFYKVLSSEKKIVRTFCKK